MSRVKERNFRKSSESQDRVEFSQSGCYLLNICIYKYTYHIYNVQTILADVEFDEVSEISNVPWEPTDFIVAYA